MAQRNKIKQGKGSRVVHYGRQSSREQIFKRQNSHEDRRATTSSPNRPDDSYLNMRSRNNDAVKKSRTLAKQRIQEELDEIEHLKCENSQMTQLLAQLTEQLNEIKMQVLTRFEGNEAARDAVTQYLEVSSATTFEPETNNTGRWNDTKMVEAPRDP